MSLGIVRAGSQLGAKLLLRGVELLMVQIKISRIELRIADLLVRGRRRRCRVYEGLMRSLPVARAIERRA